MPDITQKMKRRALANFLNQDVQTIECDKRDDCMFQVADANFLVLNEAEADVAAADMALAQILSLSDELLYKHSKKGVTHHDIKVIKAASGVETMMSLMVDPLALAEEAVALGGRAAFICEDGEENEEGCYNVYRLN